MGGTDQDLDEFEKLLGEIPNVTSANPNPEESVPVSSTQNLKGSPLKVENGKSSSPATFPNYYHASQGPGTSPNRNSTFYRGMSFERSNPASVKSFQGSFDQKLEMNANLEGSKMTVKNNCQSPIKNVGREDSNLPEDQSLTSAFTQLNFKDEAAVEQLSPSLVNSKALQNCTYLLEAQYPNCVKQPISGLNSGNMIVPPLTSPNTLSGMNLLSPRRNGIDKFNVEINAQENGNFLKFDVQELKKKKHGLCQPLENFECNFEEQQHTLPIYSTAMPLAPSLNTFQVLSNVPAPGFEFSVTPYQQPYFLEAQSPIPFIQPQELSQSHIAWRYMEEERYYRMHQQYLYLQQLQNQGSVPNNIIQENGNSTIRPRTIRQQCFEMPITHEVEQENKVPVWNNAAFCRRFHASELALTGRGCRSCAQGFCGNDESCPFAHDQKQTSMSTSIHSSPTYSAKDFEAVQTFNKVGKHTFPEKILTRSHGLNSLRAINPGSIEEHELQNHANTGGRVLGDGSFHHQPSMLNAGSFQLRGCSGDVLDLRHGNSRIQPQKYNSVDEVAGRIYRMAKDQNGCRFLQRKFTEGTAEDINKIFFEIIDHIVELMTDPFGNYLVQKLLEVCNEVQRMQILRAITRKPGDLVKISSDMHGTRAVQKVIETLKTPEQFSIVVSSLKPGIVSLIKDQNGNHVAQRCLQYLMPHHSEFLFEAVTAHCFELATDRHGCCVLQKCLSNSDFEQKRHLILEITSNALVLSQDPFGNYVVQFILELQIPWATADALDQLDGNYGNLSMQKYSSNVVEKCLKFGGEERRPRIIKELIHNSCLDQILLHPYGNYVIQAALNNSKGALHAAVVEAIEPHVPALKTSPFGKKVLSCYSLRK
ncbi:zinc finger protein [Macleaya cordata]|uniref:Zinc finger protein n=1 Tax=Macleaya cordata TaxID=56857 RepID=A0A200R102_MACCD|nr:zinc finger protein [Macleaya cordata]